MFENKDFQTKRSNFKCKTKSNVIFIIIMFEKMNIVGNLKKISNTARMPH